MHGQWVSQTRKLNRHYQSMHVPTPPQKDFIVYTHAMRYSTRHYFPFSGFEASVYRFQVLQADAGSEHTFTYKAADDDTLVLDLKYGLAPNYISPYLGGSNIRSQGGNVVSAIGGKARNIVPRVKVTLEIDATFTIDLLKLETDEYAAAGATYTKTYKTGDNANLYFLQGLAVVCIDANDDTNYLITGGGVEFVSKSLSTYAVLNVASNWTQNRVPTQYKVNINDWVDRSMEIELQGYINDEFKHCEVTNAIGSATIKLSVEELGAVV